MASANKRRASRRKPPAALGQKSLNTGKQSRARLSSKGSRVGDDLVEAVQEMAKHLRGEIHLQMHQCTGSDITPVQIKAIRLKVASSRKEFERLFGIPARTMEAYEQGRRNLDGAMRALLRIIDREPQAALKALAA